MTSVESSRSARSGPPTSVRIATFAVLGGVLLFLVPQVTDAVSYLAHSAADGSRGSSATRYVLLAAGVVDSICVFAVVLAWRMHRGSISARTDLTVLAVLDLVVKMAAAYHGSGVLAITIDVVGMLADLVFLGAAFRRSVRVHLNR